MSIIFLFLFQISSGLDNVLYAKTNIGNKKEKETASIDAVSLNMKSEGYTKWKKKILFFGNLSATKYFAKLTGNYNWSS